MSVDRSTIWPYRATASRASSTTSATRTRPGSRPSARSASSTAATRSSSPPAAGATTALVLGAARSPATRSRSPRARYFGTGVTFEELERWGLRHVEFDQTGPPPDGVDLVWLEAPSNPFLTMPDLEAAAAHPAPRRRRLDRGDAGPPAPARARRRLRPAQRDEVPRRPRRRAARRRRLQARRATPSALQALPRRAPASSPRPTRAGSCSAA